MGGKTGSQEVEFDKWMHGEASLFSMPVERYYRWVSIMWSFIVGGVAGGLLVAFLLGYIWQDAPHGWECADDDLECMLECYEARGWFACHIEAKTR